MLGMVQWELATVVLLGATETTIFLHDRCASLKRLMHCRLSLHLDKVPSSFLTSGVVSYAHHAGG